MRQADKPVLPVGCAVVGCGDVSGKYARTLLGAPIVDIVACCDVTLDRAKRMAAACPNAIPASLPEVLANPAVELVINLTPPQQHAAITLQALYSGKSVYSEKPLSLGRDEANRLRAEARARGLLLGCAPDTFLGPAAQAARRAIDEGRIGRVVGAAAAMLAPGHERSCPTPQIFYRPGAGPLLDMGVYYLTMLVTLLGPVRCAIGMQSCPSPTRLIDTGPQAGTTFISEVPTHVVGLIEFVQGSVATLTASFEVWGTMAPHLEIFGTEATLSIPDPNFYTGSVRLRAARSRGWIPLPYSSEGPRGRGIGVIDMAHAMRGAAEPRAGVQLGAHVLDAMLALASEERLTSQLASSCHRPPPLRPTSHGGCWWCERCGGT